MDGFFTQRKFVLVVKLCLETFNAAISLVPVATTGSLVTIKIGTSNTVELQL